jgi:uncharacterized protein YqgV (UPF0045/DUF77 family)
MRRSIWFLLAALLLGSCASSGPEAALGDTANNLSEINSGVLDLEMKATAADEDQEESTGFVLSGPFALPKEDQLPVTNLEYTQIAGEESDVTGFISTADSAYVVIDEQAYELPPEQVEPLRGTGEETEDIFGEADFESWLDEPKVEEGPELDGVATEVVSGDLDVVAALNDIFEVARHFGADETVFPVIEGDDAEHLSNAVESAHLKMVTGTEDRLMRDLKIEIRFDVQHQAELAEVLGSLAGVEFSFHMEIQDPNEAVVVEPPTDALPYTDLAPL